MVLKRPSSALLSAVCEAIPRLSVLRLRNHKLDVPEMEAIAQALSLGLLKTLELIRCGLWTDLHLFSDVRVPLCACVDGASRRWRRTLRWRSWCLMAR